MGNGILRMSASELMYQRRNFYEVQRLNGVCCSIHTIKKTNENEEVYDIYNDIQRDENAYDNSFMTYMTFDTTPTIKTLKSLGWYIDNDTLPVIAYIPLIYQNKDGQILSYNPSIDDKIVLPSNHTLSSDILADEESFLIKKLVGQGYPDTVYYVANLVHHRRDF